MSVWLLEGYIYNSLCHDGHATYLGSLPTAGALDLEAYHVLDVVSAYMYQRRPFYCFVSPEVFTTVYSLRTPNGRGGPYTF